MDIFTYSEAFQCFQLATAHSIPFANIISLTVTKTKSCKASDAIPNLIAADF